MKFNYLIILIPIVLYSQNPSSVSGRVVDIKSNYLGKKELFVWPY